MKTTEKRFDVVIIDSTDPIGPGEVLFTEDFYRAAKGCLKDGGILVTQNGVPFVQGEELTRSMRALGGLFADVTCYTATVPGYVGGPMAFGWGSDALQRRQESLETLERRFAAADIDVRYYTPAVHRAAFALPGYIEDLVQAGCPSVTR